MTIRTALLGRRGFREVGQLCLRQAEYLKAQVAALPDWSVPFSGQTFNEFVVRHAHCTAGQVVSDLAAEGVLPGVDLGAFFPDQTGDLLVSVTEKHDKAALDRLVAALGRVR